MDGGLSNQVVASPHDHDFSLAQSTLLSSLVARVLVSQLWLYVPSMCIRGGIRDNF